MLIYRYYDIAYIIYILLFHIHKYSIGIYYQYRYIAISKCHEAEESDIKRKINNNNKKNSRCQK